MRTTSNQTTAKHKKAASMVPPTIDRLSERGLME
jgi:hypothetical protein